MGGEFGFVLLAGIVATKACSAEITTFGGISLAENWVRLPLNLEETCISLERGSLGRSSTSWRRRSPEATFGVAMLLMLLLGKMPPLLLVDNSPPYSETFGVELLVLLLLGKTPPTSNFGVRLLALLLRKTPPNPNSSPPILLCGKIPPSLLVEVGN